jgi:hypothetical protein
VAAAAAAAAAADRGGPRCSPLLISFLPQRLTPIQTKKRHALARSTTTTQSNSDLRANSQPRKKYSRHFAFKGRGRKRRPAAKAKHERVTTRPSRPAAL